MFSLDDYTEMIIIYGECGRNARETARVFSQRFPDRPLDSKVILRTITRTRETGQVVPLRKGIGGAPKRIRTVENEEAVLNAFEENSRKSIREVARELDISRSTVQRVMKNDRQHPFHFTRVQHLQPEDYPARVEFCLWLLEQENLQPNFVSNIMFSDESIFARQGCFNAHNLHVWANENPHAIFQGGFQHRFSINFWSAIIGDRVVCKLFRFSFLF